MTGLQEITKDTLVGDILALDAGAAVLFQEMGMHCLGCPSSMGETVEEACLIHGGDCGELVRRLGAYLSGR
ncbi:MAG: DUF1858 domain-containing protein [Clostridia bacterium]|nr:DUF1858 domain-containing protein [Clostridia bacterium]MDR3645373.1 DUF1858 domain-containing protein [Clostridia bacterium]